MRKVGEGVTESRDHGWCDLGKSLPSLGISFFLWKCGVGLGHSKGPFGPDVKGFCAIISAVVGVSCVRKLLLKAFLMTARSSGYAGARWANPWHPVALKGEDGSQDPRKLP